MDLETIKQGIIKAGDRWATKGNDIDDLKAHVRDLEDVLYDVVAYLQELEEAAE